MLTPSVIRHQAPNRSQWWRLGLVFGPVVISAVLTLFAAAYPGGHHLLGLFAVPIWLLSGLIWVSLLMTRDSRYRRSPWIIAMPLIGAFTLALANSPVPMRVAFLISESALTAYSQSLPEQDRVSFREQRVGLFTIETAQRWGGITRLGVANTGGTLEKCGFSHVPEGRTKDLGVSTVNHVIGDWYATCTNYD
ncbi:hypothetical protein GCM10010517_25130 [Streptosporangium fragile]|uniref:DUF1109 domain-containing protein n=2 Tax=Actinomycetes TaxID=1760 RepID=A0ABN3VUX2_9ACTN